MIHRVLRGRIGTKSSITNWRTEKSLNLLSLLGAREIRRRVLIIKLHYTAGDVWQAYARAE